MVPELLKRAQKGDKSAFTALISENETRMYRMAYLYVRNKDDALDVVQEAVIKAYRGIRSLNKPEYAASWLVRITINCAMDMLRRRGREISFPPEDMEAIAVSENDDGEILEKVTLEGLMNGLNASEKQLVILKYYCEMTFAEIADDVAMPEGTVKTVFYRALEKLRKYAKEM